MEGRSSGFWIYQPQTPSQPIRSQLCAFGFTLALRRRRWAVVDQWQFVEAVPSYSDGLAPDSHRLPSLPRSDLGEALLPAHLGGASLTEAALQCQSITRSLGWGLVKATRLRRPESRGPQGRQRSRVLRPLRGRVLDRRH